MTLSIGFVVLAAILQGVFLLPMHRTREWEWEHTWLAFSFVGMILCNWILAVAVLPNPLAIYSTVPHREILILAGFGLAWGCGAILFGMSMDILGLTLGYPLIMGLNASVGTLMPLLRLHGEALFAGRRVFIAIGTAIAIVGIIVCSVAGAWRESHVSKVHNTSQSRFVAGLIIAVASGILSCLPNIGLTFGTDTLRSAHHLGAPSALAGNAVWFLFFTCGGIINILYCFQLIVRHGTTGKLFARSSVRNWWWSLAMGAMWIGSFYLYGVGAAKLGSGGNTIGWPILVSLSIAIGVLGGLGRGEWRNASTNAKTLLSVGLSLIILAVLIIPCGITSN